MQRAVRVRCEFSLRNYCDVPVFFSFNFDRFVVVATFKYAFNRFTNPIPVLRVVCGCVRLPGRI